MNKWSLKPHLPFSRPRRLALMPFSCPPQSHLKESPSDSRLSPPPPDESMSTSEMDQELHYANLSFHGLKPPNCRDQEATEYSEIKIRK